MLWARFNALSQKVNLALEKAQFARRLKWPQMHGRSKSAWQLDHGLDYWFLLMAWLRYCICLPCRHRVVLSRGSNALE